MNRFSSLMLAFLAHAGTSFAFHFPPEVRRGAALLAADLAPLVETFERDILGYNWRALDVLNDVAIRPEDQILPGQPLAVDDPRFVAYANTWRASWSRHNPTDTTPLGWSLHLTNSPNWMDHYGFQDWALLEVRLPAGTRNLDLRPYQGLYLPIAEETLHYLRQGLGCEGLEESFPVTAAGEVRQGVTKHALTKSSDCNDVVQLAVACLRLDSITYRVNQSIATGFDNHDSKTAFYLLQARLDATTVKGFVNTLGEDSSPLKQREYRRMQAIAASFEAQPKAQWFPPFPAGELPPATSFYGYRGHETSTRSFRLEAEPALPTSTLDVTFTYPDLAGVSQVQEDEVFGLLVEEGRDRLRELLAREGCAVEEASSPLFFEHLVATDLEVGNRAVFRHSSEIALRCQDTFQIRAVVQHTNRLDRLGDIGSRFLLKRNGQDWIRYESWSGEITHRSEPRPLAELPIP